MPLFDCMAILHMQGTTLMYFFKLSIQAAFIAEEWVDHSLEMARDAKAK